MMVEGDDASGTFVTTCFVAANSIELARATLITHSASAGWHITDWEEHEDMGPWHGDPGVVETTGRAYFESGKQATQDED
jgi:hypothetical protein